MKTTIDISDIVLKEAGELAAKERTTLSALVEEGLRTVIDERKQRKPFRFRKVTFKGTGLTPEAQGMSWDEIRELSYEDRGD
jgi:hypothetical protein